MENGYSLNEAAWNIHSGIMFNDDRINVIMHLHTLDGVAVSSQKNGFLPLCQDSVLFYDKIAYHDYEGIVINPDEAPRLLQDLGDKRVLVLRNHGNIYVGLTMAEAFFYMFFFEKGCSIQVRASSAEVVPISDAIISSVPAERDVVLNSMHASDDAEASIEFAYHQIFEVWKRRMKRLFPDVADWDWSVRLDTETAWPGHMTTSVPRTGRPKFPRPVGTQFGVLEENSGAGWSARPGVAASKVQSFALWDASDGVLCLTADSREMRWG